MSDQSGVEAFFAYARERHAIYQRRARGQPRPWTKAPILAKYRFTNIFRELDRTTVWFREHVRDQLIDRPEVLPATVIFRWFNRISTGEAMFCQMDLFHGRNAFWEFLEQPTLAGGVRQLKKAILAGCGKGPYVTGAYTINSGFDGKTKLDGVLGLIKTWFETHPDWREYAEGMGPEECSMEAFCEWVRSPYLGDFMAYEVACDLRWTPLLENAEDVDTWANIGPGALRGLNRIFRPSVPVNQSHPTDELLHEMRILLEHSRRNYQWWPTGWMRWELREVEHTLCEFDKYERVRLGQGRPRGTI